MSRVTEGEYARKLIHYSASFIPLLYYFFLPRYIMLWITGGAFVFMVIAELTRLLFPLYYQIYLKIFGWMIRSYEKKRYLTGATYVFLGTFLSIFFLPKNIAIISMLFLTIGDPTACLVGLSIGRIKLPGSEKTLEGSLAFILAGLIATFWIPELGLLHKSLGVSLAAVIEYLPFKKFDDNLMIPIITGTFLKLIS